MPQKMQIVCDNNATAEAQAPLIVSASRSTDIPAFYADWFLARLKKGYSAWTNPFNGKTLFVSYEKTRFIVFWSKNPKPLLENGILDWLTERGIGCYVQFTLNDYECEGLEKGVPKLAERIDTFRRLSDRLRKDDRPSGVVWRFDPMILTDEIGVEELLAKAENIGNQLKGYTEKMVFSFADIAAYRKVKSNLEKNQINYREFDDGSMDEIARGLCALNAKWGFALATCGERINLDKYGIAHNKCVDDDLMIRLAYKDRELMDFLGVEIKEPDLFGAVPDGALELGNGVYAVKKKNNKDKGQREACGCIVSKDIGQYNTCPHLCEYCYANASKDVAVANYQKHCANRFGESIL